MQEFKAGSSVEGDKRGYVETSSWTPCGDRTTVKTETALFVVLLDLFLLLYVQAPGISYDLDRWNSTNEFWGLRASSLKKDIVDTQYASYLLPLIYIYI